MKLTAVVFVFWPAEESLIESCLKSVAFADEIIIIDNGATKKTLEIAKRYTSQIYQSKDSSFATRHNLGKEKATGDWLLYIDSDERVSKKLSEEIKALDDKHDAYQLNRVNFYLGKQFRYGDRFPDFVTRLFRKDKLVSWVGEIHESSKVDGSIGKLSAPFYHLTHRNIYSMLEKTANFSEHEAKLRLAAKHPPVVGWRLCRVFLTEVFNRIVKYQGFRQGTEGWIDGIFQAFSLFIVYVRLWELQRKTPLDQTYRELDRQIMEGTI